MKVESRLAPIFRGFSWGFRVFIPVLVVLAVFSLGASAQTVDEVIAKNIQAKGGLEKLKSVRTMRTTARFTQGPIRVEYRQEIKRADKVREEYVIQGLAQVQAYDGKTGWQISPFGGRKDPELLSQDDLKSLVVDSDIDGPLDYLDADSFLELKIEVQTTIRGTLQESELYFGDYEQVNGIYYPFAIDQAQKGSASRTQISVEKIEQNMPLEDSRFSMPASKPETKAAPAGK